MKTDLMYSPLTDNIYWGRINEKTGIATGNKKDVTNTFLYCVEQKFPVGFGKKLTIDGIHASTIYNIEAGKIIYQFDDVICQDDIDLDKYEKLASELGLTYFDMHGACDSCINDVVGDGIPCRCDKLKKTQHIAMWLSKKSEI